MSDSTRWGRSLWEGSEFAFSEEDAVSHSLKVRIGVDTPAYVKSLGISHPLKTRTIAIDTRVFSVGYGPAAIHPLETAVTIDVVTDPAHLLFSHNLKTTVTIDVLTDEPRLRHSHNLVTLLIEATDTLSRIGVAHFMLTLPRVQSSSEAVRLNIGHGLRAALRVQTPAFAQGIVTLSIPTILEVLSAGNPRGYTAGILNLLRYPIVPASFEDWNVYGGAILALDPDHVWTGDRSARVQVPDIGGSGIEIQGVQGLRLTPYGGSVLWGAVLLAADAPGTTFEVWTRAKYLDGTIEDGDPEAIVVTAGGSSATDWDIVQAPFLSLDEDKILSTAWIVIEPTLPLSSGALFYVGAAQIEYDLMMYGPGDTVVTEAA